MNTIHKYKYEIDLNTETSAAKVIRLVGNNKRVLEIGAGPGSVTEILKMNNNCQVSAIEIDETAMPFLYQFCEAVYSYDLNDRNWINHFANIEKYDVVIAGDVLEHLYDPLITLKNIKELLRDDGYIVISLPHAAHNSIIACLLNNDFAYQDSGLLDRTHIRFFAMKNMQTLFKEAGLKIVRGEFVMRSPQYTELSYYWNKLSTATKHQLSKNKFGKVYQVVIKAKVATCTDPEIILETLSVPEKESTFSYNMTVKNKIFYYIKQFLLPYLSQNMRTRIKSILIKCGIKI